MEKIDNLENMPRDIIGVYLAEGTKEYQSKMQESYLENGDIGGLKKSLKFSNWADGVLNEDRKILKKRGDLLGKIAYTDPLTGLGNRNALADKLNEEYSRMHRNGRSFAVVALDIDYFKKVNDMYGHDIGDKALCTFADTIKEHIRPTDNVYRQGGEEFCLILSDIKSKRSALGAVSKLRKEMESVRVDTEKGPVGMTFSAGFYLPNENDSHSGALKKADDALYHAKEGGLTFHGGRNQIRPHYDHR